MKTQKDTPESGRELSPEGFESSHMDSPLASSPLPPLPFQDNRPEALQLRKLQDAANNSPQVRQLKVMQRMVKPDATDQDQPQERAKEEGTDQKLLGDQKSTPTEQKPSQVETADGEGKVEEAKKETAEIDFQEEFETWLTNHAPATMAQNPNSEKTEGDTYRCRWFDVVPIGDKSYTLGVNIHLGGNNYWGLGSCWIEGHGLKGIESNKQQNPVEREMEERMTVLRNAAIKKTNTGAANPGGLVERGGRGRGGQERRGRGRGFDGRGRGFDPRGGQGRGGRGQRGN